MFKSHTCSHRSQENHRTSGISISKTPSSHSERPRDCSPMAADVSLRWPKESWMLCFEKMPSLNVWPLFERTKDGYLKHVSHTSVTHLVDPTCFLQGLSSLLYFPKKKYAFGGLSENEDYLYSSLSFQNEQKSLCSTVSFSLMFSLQKVSFFGRHTTTRWATSKLGNANDH